MNTHIFDFLLGILKQLKSVTIRFDHPASIDGITYITITSNVFTDDLVVGFRPGYGFGFYTHDVTYGEGPEKIFAITSTALDYFKSLISQTGEYVVVRETGDADNVIEGGYNYHHEIIEHNISGENGVFEYDRRTFPSGAIDHSKPTSKNHIKSMTILMDDEIALLRERGVQVKILPKK